jgi:pSer/pThr/pTyr-binding forkhead associated (FHA) protein
MPQLIMTTASGERRLVSLGPNDNTIGRSPQNSIVVDSLQASRVHAVVTVEPAFVTITDLGSRNGTFVNGDRIETQMLVHDDAIRLGDCEMRFVAGDQEFSKVEAERVSTIPRLLVDLDLDRENEPTTPGDPSTTRVKR